MSLQGYCSSNQNGNLPNQSHKIENKNYALEKSYKNMITSFRIPELRKLLRVFGFNYSGNLIRLRSRAIELLHNAPPGIHRTFHYETYYDQIVEIYRSMTQQKKSMFMNMGKQQQSLDQNTQSSQPVTKQMITSHQKMHQMQRDIDRNYNIIPTAPYTTKPINKQVSTVQYQMGHYMDLEQINSSAYSPTLLNIKFRNMPFYEVIEDIIEPNVLFEIKSHLIPNTKRIMEVQYQFVLTHEQVNYLTNSLINGILNKNGKDLYQAQIRIGTLVPGSEELYDFLPLGLGLQIFSNYCTINCSRKNPEAIDCSNLLELNSNIPNIIKFTWVPDKKTYVWGMYLVKKLSSKCLIQKLMNKETISSEETTNDILKIFANLYPSLTSIQLSLVCPLGQKRMQIPVKSINCDHLQCFDVNAFILMNEKRSTWVCPVCNKPCYYEDLGVYSYFINILTSPNVSEYSTVIEILADGTWRAF